MINAGDTRRGSWGTSGAAQITEPDNINHGMWWAGLCGGGVGLLGSEGGGGLVETQL